MEKIYDVAILGGGPAGLSAGLYAGRAGLSAVIVEKGQAGGQIMLTDSLENYPGGLLEGETGPALIARMRAQAEAFGARFASDAIKSVELKEKIKVLKSRRNEYRAKTVIVATGASPRPIGCENEQNYIGAGVSYCATCDAPFFKGKRVFVVGGGDAAVEEALYLTRFASHVTLIHRRDELRAAKSIQDKAFAEPKLSFLWDSVVVSIGGEGMLSKIHVKNVKNGEVTRIQAEPGEGALGLFGFIGSDPNTALFDGQMEMERGYLVADGETRTSLPGVFAAGDVRVKSVRQVVTAAADGAMAAVLAGRYLEEA